jgi:hypothetical protein
LTLDWCSSCNSELLVAVHAITSALSVSRSSGKSLGSVLMQSIYEANGIVVILFNRHYDEIRSQKFQITPQARAAASSLDDAQAMPRGPTSIRRI